MPRGTIIIAVLLWTAAAASAGAPLGSGAPARFEALVDGAKTSMMGDPGKALEIARQAETAAAKITPPPARQQALATSLWLQAEALTRTNQMEGVRPLIDRGLALAAKDGKNTKLDGDLNMALARYAAPTGDMELALKSFQNAHNIFAAVGEARSQSIALQGLASIYGEARDYQHAFEYYKRSSQVFAGDPALEMSAANNLGNALKQLERYDEALKDFDRALALSTKLGSTHLQARVLTNIASVQALRRNLGAAEIAANKALKLLGDKDPGGWARFAWGIKAEIEYNRGALDAALADLAKAFEGVDPRTSTAPYREIHEIAYKIYRAKGNFAEALAHHEAFKRLSDQGQEVSASANLALTGARFDFATQQLEIARLSSEKLERNARLAEADANQQRTLLASLLVISALSLSWIGWGYLSVKRHRNEINAANIKLQTTVRDLNDEIDGRKAIEDRLREAKDGAEQANRSKSQFLANMSHELRTPLNAIIGFAEIMSREIMGPIGTPAYKQYTKDILASAQHLFSILSDILDMARIDAGKSKLHESAFDVNAVVDDALRMLNEEARQAGKTLAFDRREPGVTLRADERLTRQILINLVSNAIKYTRDKGHVDVRIERAADGGADLVVADNGIGIAREQFALIMEPFGQVEDAFARSKGGIGLGLPLVKSLIELHQGTFTIDSVVAKGTTARIHFPPARVIGAPPFEASRANTATAQAS